jgi:hypothetical protein
LPTDERLERTAALQLQWEKEAQASISTWCRVEKPDRPTFYYNLKTGETMWEDPVLALLPGTYLKCKSLELLQNEGYVALLLGEYSPPRGCRTPGETCWARRMARRVLVMGCIGLDELDADTDDEEEFAVDANPLNLRDLPLLLEEQEKDWANAERESCCQSEHSSPCSSQSTDVGSSCGGDTSDEEACPDSPASVCSRARIPWDVPCRSEQSELASTYGYLSTGLASFSGDECPSDIDDVSPASVASATSLHIDISDELTEDDIP